MAIVNLYNLEFKQTKIFLLHRELEETIFMEQHGDFVLDNYKVYLFKKYLYGLKKILRNSIMSLFLKIV